jgi:hypothetical protein
MAKGRSSFLLGEGHGAEMAHGPVALVDHPGADRARARRRAAQGELADLGPAALAGDGGDVPGAEQGFAADLGEGVEQDLVEGAFGRWLGRRRLGVRGGGGEPEEAEQGRGLAAHGGRMADGVGGGKWRGVGVSGRGWVLGSALRFASLVRG